VSDLKVPFFILLIVGIASLVLSIFQVNVDFFKLKCISQFISIAKKYL